MAKQSAGILLYRPRVSEIEIFLVHPGGPFYKNKDLGSWTIPKGEFSDGEDALSAAQREFLEETGVDLTGDFHALQPIKQKGGKLVFCWAVKGTLDPQKIQSNSFSLEWPPRSGKFQHFPEIDKGEWFTEAEARQKILNAQLPLIDQLKNLL